jgi:hypothetical protein
MRRRTVVQLLVVALCAVLIGCSGSAAGGGGGQNGLKTYSVGDTGPAGGIVFYDKGDSTGGWRYLEAGLTDLGAGWGWGPATASGVTATAIGTGKTNTDAIDALYPSGQIFAARTCKQYSFGGYNDWFLPSKDECATMLTALALHGLGSFDTTRYYWSSSEQSAGYAYWEGYNGTTVSSGGYDKTDRGLWMRPIRMF